jgi:hypothetical protein
MGFGGDNRNNSSYEQPRAPRQNAGFAPANRFQTAASFAPAAPRREGGDGLDGRSNRFAKRG